MVKILLMLALMPGVMVGDGTQEEELVEVGSMGRSMIDAKVHQSSKKSIDKKTEDFSNVRKFMNDDGASKGSQSPFVTALTKKRSELGITSTPNQQHMVTLQDFSEQSDQVKWGDVLSAVSAIAQSDAQTINISGDMANVLRSLRASGPPVMGPVDKDQAVTLYYHHELKRALKPSFMDKVRSYLPRIKR